MNLYELINNDAFFWFCALTGSGMFIIQFCLNLIGLGENDYADEGNSIGSVKFNWLSRQALTGFLMMFGWSSLTCQKEFGLEGYLRISIAILAGVLAVFATGLIFKIANKLQSPGTVFKIEDTIGQEATVYQKIPNNGVGKISICMDDFTREIDALSSNKEEILSFTRVQVIKKADDKTVVVKII
jgi:hypothetical protein